MTLTNSNLLVYPVPRALILNWDERPIGSALERDAHAGPLLGDGLDVRQPDIPLRAESLGAHEHDAVVREHDQHIAARELQVRDVVFVEVLAVVGRLEPELTECFSLRVRAYYSVCSDETSKTHAIQAFGIEHSRGVPYTLSKICSFRQRL